MNIKNQVLSIEQVQELQELGFDVEKNASVRWCDCSVCKRTYAPCFSYNELRVDKKECPLTREVPTLTIGDIIEVLPQRITMNNTGYILKTLHKFDISYTDCAGRKLNAFNLSLETLNLIDALFETLKWCIKEKHIEL